MKKTFHIHLKKGGKIKFEAVEKFTSDTNIKVIDYFEKETKCLYLNIEHNQINTILDLTNVAPYTILFNKNFGFESATFNNNEIAETPFLLSTQYKQVIFIPSFMNFSVNDILLHTFIYYYEKEYEESNKEDLKENWHEHRLFLNGYGKFPYIILKTGYAIFMQIPIHFNANGDFDNYPGTSLDGINEALISEYRKDITSELHDQIIEHCKWVKSKIEADKNREARICLVEGPESAYYFEGDSVTFSDKIPHGGTLVTQQNKIIAMNVDHYIESRPKTYSMQGQMGLTIEEQVELLATNPYRYYLAPNVWIGRNLSRIHELEALFKSAEIKGDVLLCNRINEVINYLFNLYFNKK
jgi:hypothetical protein